MTQVLDMEPQIEATIDLLCEKLDERFVRTGISCNIADYLLYGTSHVIYILKVADIFSCMGCDGPSNLFGNSWDAREGL